MASSRRPQRAMAVAMVYPVGTKGKSIPEIGNTPGEALKTFQNNLSMAMPVLAHRVARGVFGRGVKRTGQLSQILVCGRRIPDGGAENEGRRPKEGGPRWTLQWP